MEPSTPEMEAAKSPKSAEAFDHKILKEVGELPIKNEKTFLPFRSLFADKDPQERQLIIFIRHFFCGACEDYVRALAKDLSPDTLSKAGVSLIIIGCGEPSCIAAYKERTSCPFPIFCDPSRAIYEKLGMVCNFGGGPRPTYIASSTIAIIWRSTMNMLFAGRQGRQGGDFKQNGGEWLFGAGELRWFNRMRNTMDHTEVGKLKEILELRDSEPETS